MCIRDSYKGGPTPLIGDKHATRPHAIQPRARIGGDSGPRLHCIRSSGMFIPRHGVCAALCLCIWTATQPLDTESWHHFCALRYTSVYCCTLLRIHVQECTEVYRSAQKCTGVHRSVQECTEVYRSSQNFWYRRSADLLLLPHVSFPTFNDMRACHGMPSCH